jgi:hypothetical protein
MPSDKRPPTGPLTTPSQSALAAMRAAEAAEKARAVDISAVWPGRPPRCGKRPDVRPGRRI